MKKIMITLCTLLAVASGKHIDAMHGYAEPGKSVKSKGGTAKSGEAVKVAPDAPKDVQAKAAKTPKLAESKSGSDVPNQNLNIVKNMHGVESAPGKNGDQFNQTFNLDNTSEMNITFDKNGNPKESTVTQYKMKKDRKGNKQISETRITKKTTYNRDGSMDESILNSQGKEAQKIRYRKDGTFDITNFDANNKPLDSTSYDASGIATEYTDYRTKAEQELTPEQKTEAQNKADQARKNAEAAQKNTPAREEAVGKAAEKAGNALENNDEPGVKTVVSDAVETVVGDRMSAEQKYTMIEQITAKIMEIGKAGKQALTATIESIRSVFNSIFDLVDTKPLRTEVSGEEADNSSESVLFKDIQDVSGSQSPTSVANDFLLGS
ncbi:hypothetical protein [Candidatus Chromulinivorax destructor]|uniref:Uncharacterized protein n=1 Tax=Candidatus Chromulinivorax destructor TaxID=2066483 RepID=A0A345ZAI0_9BACT|nr:hypothetical protein [Candidatus Chromulinivorax destructor]AXK60297.1 hypothetical protein C0J27_00835 [Candidatus Chromulinivorax destructor]